MNRANNIVIALKEEQTDTPEQEILPKVTKESSASKAPVWEIPFPTITNVVSISTPQEKLNLEEPEQWRHTCLIVLQSLNNGSVVKKIGFINNLKLPVKEIKKRLRDKIWNSRPPVVKFEQHLTSVRECKSVLLNNIPSTMMNPLHIKWLILLKTDFDPFTKQTMDVRVLKPAPRKKRAQAILLFSNNEDCMKVYYGLHALVLLHKKVDVSLDWGGKIAKAYNCIYPSQNETKEGTLPPIDNSSQNGTHNETSDKLATNGTVETVPIKQELADEVDISEPTEEEARVTDLELGKAITVDLKDKDPTDKLATNGTAKTVPIKQELADDVDISEPTEEEPRVTDLEIGKAVTKDLKDIDFDAMIETQEMDTGRMIETTNDAECDPYGNEAEGDTKCTVVHVKGLPVQQDTTKKIFYIRELQIGRLSANNKKKITGECLLKFTTHSDAVQVCDYLNKTTFEAKLDIGNAISESVEPIVIYWDGQAKKPVHAKFSDEWYLFDSRCTNREDENDDKYETYGLSTYILKALKIPQGPLTNSVVISNLSAKVNEAKLMEVFSMAGQIKRICMFTVRLQGNNIARIEYDHPVEAVQAISMFSRRKLYGRIMHVRMNVSQMSMPVGLEDVGEGLGKDGTPLKDVRANILETKMFSKLAETKRFEATNGADFAANKKPCNKTANTDITSILGTVIESLRDAATAQGLLQSETNRKVFADVISALEKHQQSSPINKPVASSSYQGLDKSTVDTESNFGINNLKSKKLFSSNTQNTTANLANIFSNPQQNSENPTTPSNHLSNPQNDTVNPVIETNKAPNASIFGSQLTNVCPSVQYGSSNPNPNVQYPFQNNSTDQNPPPFANIPTNSGGNAVFQSVSNYMTYITPTPNYPPNMLPQNYVPNPAYIPNPAPMTMNYQGALPISSDRAQMTANLTVPNQVVPPKQIIWVPGNARGVASHGQVATDMASLDTPLPFTPEAPRFEPPSKSETPNKIQKVTNVNQKPTDLVDLFSERLERILTSIQLRTKQNTNPQKAPQPSQSKYETESYEIGKKDETSRKRDYEGKITNGMAGNTNDPKKLKPVLYFRNLPDSVSTEALTMKMQEVGDIMFSQVTGKGRAVVCFKTVEDTKRCIQLFHLSKVDGQTIEVRVKQKLQK